MKKILLILLIISCMPQVAFGDVTYEYPAFYGTKKCEIIPKIINKKDNRRYGYTNKGLKSEYYIMDGDLYNNNTIYKSGVYSIYLIFNDSIIYGVKNNDKKDIYLNNKKIETVDYVEARERHYNAYLNRYYIGVTKEGVYSILSSGELFLHDEFKFHKRYFSRSNNFFIDSYSNTSGIYLEKDGKVIYQNKNNYIRNVKISNDNKNYSIFGYDHQKKELFFINDGVKTIGQNIVHFEYSPSGKDFYYVIKEQGKYLFYKNDLKIGEFKGERILNSFQFKFLNENDFYMIVTDWSNYGLIKNGKTLISYENNLQIKAIIKKENGDKYIVIKNKIIGQDTLYINGEKILDAQDIDERYLNEGIGTFVMFPNHPNKLQSNQYYTYVTINKYYYILVNGFLIPNMYDYLRMENGLDNFTFFSTDFKTIGCKDITYLYPVLKNNRREFEKILGKIKNLNNYQNEILLKKMSKMEINHLSGIKQDLYKMVLGNLNNFKKEN